MNDFRSAVLVRRWGFSKRAARYEQVLPAFIAATAAACAACTPRCPEHISRFRGAAPVTVVDEGPRSLPFDVESYPAELKAADRLEMVGGEVDGDICRIDPAACPRVPTLAAWREAPLHAPTEFIRVAETERVSFRESTPPRMIRAVKTASGVELVVKELVEEGSRSDAWRLRIASMSVDARHWSEIAACIRRTALLETPPPTPSLYHGPLFILEVSLDGRYHAVEVWEPPECARMLWRLARPAESELCALR